MDNKGYLLLLFDDKLMWCSKSKSISISDNNVNPSWVFTKKFTYQSNYQDESIIMKNIYSPQWMIENETFFYDIIMNDDMAFKEFEKH